MSSRKQSLVVSWQISWSLNDVDRCNQVERTIQKELKTATATIKWLHTWAAAQLKNLPVIRI